MDIRTKKMKKLTVEQAADILNMDVQSLRVGIQKGAFPFGTAYKVGKRFTYFINPKLFEEYTGVRI